MFTAKKAANYRQRVAHLLRRAGQIDDLLRKVFKSRQIPTA